MGAVLGIAAFGRTQEKMAGANNGGAQTPTTGLPSVFPAPSAPAASGFANTSFSATPTTNGFGSAPTTSFTPPASWGSTPVATTSTGKKIVPQDDQPAI
jgi:hypothetical protein